MEIFKLVSNSLSLWSYINGGGLELDLAESHIQAAREAWAKVAITIDKKMHLASVVNHLESAESTLLRYFTTNKFLKTVTQWNRLEEARSDFVRVELMMCACYLYLGDKKPALRCLDKVSATLELKDSFIGMIAMLYITLPLIIVQFYVRGFQGKNIPFSVTEIEESVKPTIQRLYAIAGELAD